MAKKKSASSPISMAAELDQKIDAAAKHLGLSKQEPIRPAMALGLEDLRRTNYDLDAAIVDAAKTPPAPISITDPPRYGGNPLPPDPRSYLNETAP